MFPIAALQRIWLRGHSGTLTATPLLSLGIEYWEVQMWKMSTGYWARTFASTGVEFRFELPARKNTRMRG